MRWLQHVFCFFLALKWQEGSLKLNDSRAAVLFASMNPEQTLSSCLTGRWIRKETKGGNNWMKRDGSITLGEQAWLHGNINTTWFVSVNVTGDWQLWEKKHQCVTSANEIHFVNLIVPHDVPSLGESSFCRTAASLFPEWLSVWSVYLKKTKKMKIKGEK